MENSELRKFKSEQGENQRYKWQWITTLPISNDDFLRKTIIKKIMQNSTWDFIEKVKFVLKIKGIIPFSDCEVIYNIAPNREFLDILVLEKKA